MTSDNEKEQKPAAITLKEFLESVPPGRTHTVTNLSETHRGSYGSYIALADPELYLFCPQDTCKGQRFFKTTTDLPRLESGKTSRGFVVYACKNCGKTLKEYSLWIKLIGAEKGEIYKFGELPPFGPPIPPRLVSLIGPDKDLFLKGLRTESQGLGIAAFAYYRRVVENQKNRIFDEIIRVSRKLNASQEFLKDLEDAQREIQFSKAIEAIKHAIPEFLLINGHNPLNLLHSALSEGLHELPDEDCLEFATSIRVVMTELAERLSQALKDETELDQAVSKLMKKKQRPSKDNP